MVATSEARTHKAVGDKPKRGNKEAMEVGLTLTFRFGDDPDDKVTMMDNKSLPMVGSVFEKRDLLIRNFIKLMLKAGASQPKVLRELVPAARLLHRKK